MALWPKPQNVILLEKTREVYKASLSAMDISTPLEMDMLDLQAQVAGQLDDNLDVL